MNIFMISTFLITVFNLISLGDAASFLNVYPRIKLSAKLPTDAGYPLMITPLLEQGSVDSTQRLSRVSITEHIGILSHSGFFTVDKKYGSNLFFWYFPPFSKDEAAPVILWLQGGPGGTSLYGLFTEIGPLVVSNQRFSLRKYHWALDHHLIFIDNPVGTGFSFTNHSEGYCSDEGCIARGLHSSLQQFFQLFPQLQNNSFYITGESYAGKYIPHLATVIHKENANQAVKINLKGIAMGNAYCDPINQLDYGNYLYQHGLIDESQREVFVKFQDNIIKEIEAQNWLGANELMDQLMDGELRSYSHFRTFTGFSYYYNYLRAKSMDDMSIFTNFLENNFVRQSVHVGGRPFSDGEIVQRYLALDMMQSVAPLIEKLLLNYRVMLYSGQLDIVVAYPGTENFLQKLQFSDAEKYRTANRNIWTVDGDIAGYVKVAGNLIDVMVRNAGHMVPYDQPKWSLDLIRRFINNNWSF